MRSAQVSYLEIAKLLRSLDGDFAELLEVLHEVESGLTGAGASGFVTLNYLSVCINNEEFVLSFNFLNKSFHNLCFIKVNLF